MHLWIGARDTPVDRRAGLQHSPQQVPVVLPTSLKKPEGRAGRGGPPPGTQGPACTGSGNACQTEWGEGGRAFLRPEPISPGTAGGLALAASAC